MHHRSGSATAMIYMIISCRRLSQEKENTFFFYFSFYSFGANRSGSATAEHEKAQSLSSLLLSKDFLVKRLF
jgi:hypothetical protein